MCNSCVRTFCVSCRVNTIDSDCLKIELSVLYSRTLSEEIAHPTVYHYLSQLSVDIQLSVMIRPQFPISSLHGNAKISVYVETPLFNISFWDCNINTRTIIIGESFWQNLMLKNEILQISCFVTKSTWFVIDFWEYKSTSIIHPQSSE